MDGGFTIRPVKPADHDWVDRLMLEEWAGETVAVHGVLFRPADLPGFVASLPAGRPAGSLVKDLRGTGVGGAEQGAESGRDDPRIGLITYHIDGTSCEIVTLNSLIKGQGIGTALMRAVTRTAKKSGCTRLWLITTNDNFPAIGFYQTRGFVLVAVHRGAVDRDRKLKPQIPLYGIEGIPIRDEVEMELILDRSGGRSPRHR